MEQRATCNMQHDCSITCAVGLSRGSAWKQQSRKWFIIGERALRSHGGPPFDSSILYNMVAMGFDCPPVHGTAPVTRWSAEAAKLHTSDRPHTCHVPSPHHTTPLHMTSHTPHVVPRVIGKTQIQVHLRTHRSLLDGFGGHVHRSASHARLR